MRLGEYSCIVIRHAALQKQQCPLDTNVSQQGHYCPNMDTFLRCTTVNTIYSVTLNHSHMHRIFPGHFRACQMNLPTA